MSVYMNLKCFRFTALPSSGPRRTRERFWLSANATQCRFLYVSLEVEISRFRSLSSVFVGTSRLDSPERSFFLCVVQRTKMANQATRQYDKDGYEPGGGHQLHFAAATGELST